MAPATSEIYTLSLHDALPISTRSCYGATMHLPPASARSLPRSTASKPALMSAGLSKPACSRTSKRSEEHTSELQSLTNLVCRLLLEKKKKLPVQTSLTTKHNS